MKITLGWEAIFGFQFSVGICTMVMRGKLSDFFPLRAFLIPPAFRSLWVDLRLLTLHEESRGKRCSKLPGVMILVLN